MPNRLRLSVCVSAAVCAAGGVVGVVFSTASAAAPARSTLVIAITPSKQALALEVRHARQIVAAIKPTNMILLGVYVNPTGIQRPPFTRPFAQLRGPEPVSAALLKDCSKLETTYQKKLCEKKNEVKLKEEGRRGAAKETTFKKRATAILGGVADGPTIEAPKSDWNLRQLFLHVGQDINDLEASVRCVVLLGGLGVRNPPSRLRADLFEGTTVIFAGWRGTSKVRDAWRKTLETEGARVEILSTGLTELDLIPRVKGCMKQLSPQG